MAIPVQCPKCQARLKAPTQALGQTLSCPACKSPVRLTLRPKSPGTEGKPASTKAPAQSATTKTAPEKASTATGGGSQASNSQPQTPAPAEEELLKEFDLFGDDEPKLSDEDDTNIPNMQLDAPKEEEDVFDDFEVLDENAGLQEEGEDFEVVEDEEEPEFEIVEEDPPKKAEKPPKKSPGVKKPTAASKATSKATPKAPPPRKAREEEPIDDEVVDIDEIEGAEEIEDVIAVEEEEGSGVDDLEVVDDIEVVDEEDAGDSCAESKLLKMQKLFMKGKKGVFSMSNAYTIHNIETRKLVGEANEVQDAGMKALRLLGGVNRSWVPTKIELTEGKNLDLLLTVGRPPNMWKKIIEIRDADDELVGKLAVTPWSTLTQKPVEVLGASGRCKFKMQPQMSKGRYLLQAMDGHKLGEMVTESAYEGKLKIQFFARGSNYYILFGKELGDRPRDKLLFLGAALGLDLLFWEMMNNR